MNLALDSVRTGNMSINQVKQEQESLLEFVGPLGHLHELLKFALGPTHLQERHTTLRVTHQIATVWGCLTQPLHLGICRASLHHHYPLPGQLAVGCTKARLALVRRVIVQHRDTCNELGSDITGSISLPRDTCALHTCEQHSQRTKATRQSDHCFSWDEIVRRLF